MELLGLKTPVVDILTRYGNGLGGSLPLDFLICRFSLVECAAAYRRDFVDLRECWTFYRRQASVVVDLVAICTYCSYGFLIIRVRFIGHNL